MDSAREATQGLLDAAGFWQVWQRFDADGKWNTPPAHSGVYVAPALTLRKDLEFPLPVFSRRERCLPALLMLISNQTDVRCPGATDLEFGI